MNTIRASRLGTLYGIRGATAATLVLIIWGAGDE